MKRQIAFALIIAAAAIASGCTSDPDTPLGSSFIPDSLIGSEPGEVFQDTLRVSSGDTSFTVTALSAKSTTMTLGRKNGTQTTMLIRFDFTPQGSDTLKTVSNATLSLRVTSATQTDSFNARFYELLAPFTESDTLTSISYSSDAIPEDGSANVDRAMQFFPSTYTLADSLVQDWIRGDAAHNGIAIVVEDTTTTQELIYGAREDEDLNPFLTVNFTDLSQSTYPVRYDGTFVEDLVPTSNLVIADGEVRRTWIPVDLDSIDTESLLHEAVLVLRIVPGSVTSGGDPLIRLYAPTSSTIGDPGLLTGETEGAAFVDVNATRVVFSVRSAIEGFLADPGTNHGLVVQYTLEGSSIRKSEFYNSSAADSLRPAFNFTFSEAPKFPR